MIDISNKYWNISIMFNDYTFSISNTSELCYCIENDELFPLLYTSTYVKKWLTINSPFKSHINSLGPASSAGEVALPVQG